MIKNKFAMGNKVRMVESKDVDSAEYVITAIVEDVVNSMFSDPKCIDFGTDVVYRYRMKSCSDSSVHYEYENNIVPIQMAEEELSLELFRESANVSHESIPKFVAGDVVTIRGAVAKGWYVISESIDMGKLGVSYELFPWDNDTQVLEFSEDDLELAHHDVSWELELTESAENGLPAWNGKLYSFYKFYGNISTHDDIDKDAMSKLNDHSVPPAYMEHILQNHSVYDRLTVVMMNPSNVENLKSALNVSDHMINDILNSVRGKIDTRNLVDIGAATGVKENEYTFTELESNFIKHAMELDTENYHYPATMTALQILDSIRDAYTAAYKTNKRIMQINKDRRNGEVSRAIRGQRIYRGYSEKYRLTIEFYYNLDLGVIESAYPIPSDDIHSIMVK